MIELTFNHKLKEELILQKSADIAKKSEIMFEIGENYLLKSENFVALSLLLKYFRESIDLVYIDPPFNTSKDFFISENRANIISVSKKSEMAYEDSMEREVFLEFLRERLILIYALISERGSLYLHTDYKVGHYIKIILDEIFGIENFKNDISRIKSNPKNFNRRAWGNEKDMLLFYVKNSKKNIWNNVTVPLSQDEINKNFSKIDSDGRRYTTVPIHAPGETKNGITGKMWRNIKVPEGRHWRTDPAEFDRLDLEGKIEWSSNGNPRIKKYADEHKGKKIQDIWNFKDPQNPIYPTEKNYEMLKLIFSQSSLPNSIILDCFAGSGSSLQAANELGRNWIGIDQSNVAINIIRQKKLGNYYFIELT